jgi:hypothetical protein
MFKKIILKALYFKKLFAPLKRRYYSSMRAFLRRLYNADRKGLYFDSQHFKPLWWGIPSRSYNGDRLVDLIRFTYLRNPRLCRIDEVHVKKSGV